MEYKVQAQSAEKYKNSSYISPRRWSSYAIQVREAMLAKPEKILEIGPGNGIVTNILKNMGFHVETLDFDSRIPVDHVGSITDEKVVEKLAEKFDLVLACQIFEHIKYEDFIKAIGILKKIAPKVIISLPHTEKNSRFFYFALKMPLIKSLTFAKKIIFKQIAYEFNGEHYWEIGTQGYALSRVIADLKTSGWCIDKHFFNPDNPYHYFFVLSQKS